MGLITISKNALVTGCAGFIGSNLCEELLKYDWNVVGIDCFTDYYSKKMKEKNLLKLNGHSNFLLLQEDLIDIPLNDYIKGIDVVFHQAGQPGVRGSWGEGFAKYVINNISATQRLLEAVKGSNIKKFVYASSSSIYGNTNTLPMSEEALPKPFSPYGLTKLAGENLCSLYHENYDVPAVCLRYFTVYGPRQRPDMAFHYFITSILSENPIKIFGDGTQMRDFTYVDDVVKANLLSANSDLSGEIINVGGGNIVKLIDVISIIESLIGKKAKLEFIEKQKGDVKDTYADNKKLIKLLKFSPQFDLMEGLKKQIEYIQRESESYSDVYRR
ncbi:MAG: NAD-dependent epimerase/dehydratase family protein [Ignavibacteriales bacterium]